VKPEIASLCHFRQANLCGPLPFRERFDAILMRNVMLYLSIETRRTLLAAVHNLTQPDGSLFLGSAEQPPESSLWIAVFSGGTSYYRPLQAKPAGVSAIGSIFPK
jgi:chemotaxis protein methyltransferase CheR